MPSRRESCYLTPDGQGHTGMWVQRRQTLKYPREAMFKCLTKQLPRLIKRIWGLDPTFRPPGYDFSLYRSHVSPQVDGHCRAGPPNKSNGVWVQENVFLKEYLLVSTWLSIIISLSIYLSIIELPPTTQTVLQNAKTFLSSICSFIPFIRWLLSEHLLWWGRYKQHQDH